MLILPVWVQEAMQLVRAFSHRLYRAYEQYAYDVSDAWLRAVDGGLVRQVSTECTLPHATPHFESPQAPVLGQRVGTGRKGQNLQMVTTHEGCACPVQDCHAFVRGPSESMSSDCHPALSQSLGML